VGERDNDGAAVTDHRDPQSAAVRPWADWVALGLGVCSVGWLLIGLLPRQLPAWPSATLGLLALVLAWPRGRPFPRATGAFLGLVGIVGASAQIAAMWGLARAFGG